MQKSSETFSKTPSLQWTQDRVKNFWNYQSRYPVNYFTSLYGHEIAKVVCKHVPRSSRILDYACGTGSLIGHLLRSGFIVGGCGLSSQTV